MQEEYPIIETKLLASRPFLSYISVGQDNFAEAAEISALMNMLLEMI